jgi:hypothetical protein
MEPAKPNIMTMPLAEAKAFLEKEGKLGNAYAGGKGDMTRAALNELAKSLGCKVTKLPKPVRFDAMLVRWILTDQHGDMFFPSIATLRCELVKLRKVRNA